jgi:hypothetical protein
MSGESEWIEVKPRRQASKQKAPETVEAADEQDGSPTTPRARTQSFGEHDFRQKVRLGKTARREKKLEWSASKSRERTERIEKRDKQREATARQREEAASRHNNQASK